jgi:hypothetical protein
MTSSSLTPIAKWTVEHEQIVALHIGRWSNEKIAKHFDKSSARISQILSDPQALGIIKEVSLRIRARMIEALEEGLADLAIKGMHQIAKTINFDDFVLGSDAKKHQDRLSLDLIKLVQGENSSTENVPPLDTALSKKLIAAIEESNNADRLAANELIREAQFTEVTSDE